MKKFLLLLMILESVALLAADQAQATIVSDRIAALNRLLPIKKITVGPDDQYHGSMDPSGQILVFTHKSNLVPHLRVQNINTGEVRDFLSLTSDSQEPIFGPAGVIVFTYYKFNARGDICYAEAPSFTKSAETLPISDAKIHCLARASGESNEARTNPFWKSKDEIGYIAENPMVSIKNIVTENIHTGVKFILASGQVFSPAMIPDGKYLSYMQIAQSSRPGQNEFKRELVVKDLASQENYIVRFALPGISGFPAFSNDGKMLYFSHYLNDSNGDNIIDGNDNAVIFRIPMEQIIANKSNQLLFPEQLTSLESSCSFPHPYQDFVFATCAFEGSLDVYQIPAGGIVPAKWTKTVLENALATSRSYQERILLLNTQKYRGSSSHQITSERLFNNHILADETAAASSYLDEMIREQPMREKAYRELLKIYIEARELKKAQPSADVSRIFREQISQLEHKLSGFQSEKNLVLILRGTFKVFTNDFLDAEEVLRQVRDADDMRPLERYLYFELAEKSLRPFLPKTEDRLLSAYHIMMRAPELDEEAHVYYAFRLLKQIQDSHKDLNERIKVIESSEKFLLDPVLTLLNSEVAVLKIILAPDAEKGKLYGQLDKYLSQTRSDYFLRKALYVRGILNFTAAAQFFYIELIATNWLKYTTQSDTEFIYAREVVQTAALDEAYSNIFKNDTFASGFFYESLSLTDDLESHYGYIESMMRRNQRAVITDRYKTLVQRSFIDDNMKFVDALLILIDQAPQAAKNPKYIAHLDQAIEKLVSMSQDRDAPSRYLLLGSCYLQKLLRTTKGLEFSDDLMQNANRSLMLAYDLGRDNIRLQASALMDLGILHAHIQNYGLAVRFFSLRKALGFSSPQEKASFEWLYANALFLSHQAEVAAAEIAEIDSSLMKPAMQERRAFYLVAAEKYPEAILAYENFFKSPQPQDQQSLAKINLSYAYALFHDKKEVEAKAQFYLAIQSLDRLSRISQSVEHPVEFEPKRLKLFAYGFLSQIGSSNERIEALKKRIELLKDNSSLLEDQKSAVIEAELQISKLLIKIDPKQVGDHLREAFKISESLGQESQFLSHAPLAASIAGLVQGILHPDLQTSEDQKRLQSLVHKCEQAFEGTKVPQDYLIYQDLKLKILERAYLAKINKVSTKGFKDLIESDQSVRVKEALPKAWQELVTLSTTLQ